MITFVYFRDNSQSSTDTALSTEAGCTGVPTSASDNRNPSECSDSHEQNGKCNLGIFFFTSNSHFPPKYRIKIMGFK